ncbi:hypothetical protein QTP70_019652 [Hemibagrus guttatus]|uniref:BTB domain-containing protein n=1 Tax=Hemibagrus guttatus TaxID=175788 RepID=A0AAE0PUF5_9TELE|nr:hypothetical protein QTP70_019652 [Hemibagrus guttatus]
MEFTRRYLPMEWEERWRREKERRKKVMEEGGEEFERENKKLTWIKAYNDSRMGMKEKEDVKNERMSQDMMDEWDDEPQKCTKETYPTEIFQAMEELRCCSVLTDLDLSVKHGLTIHAHSLVLAALRFKLLLCIWEFPGFWSSAKKEEERERKKDAEKNKRRIVGEEHRKVNLQSIRQLWEDRVGCDVELEAEGRTFHVTFIYIFCPFSAHRVILSSSSDYFHAMFRSGMKETHQTSVSLLMMGANELEALLHCCYSGHLFLDWGCVFELTSTALQFQFQPALSICLSYLEQQIDVQSCLDVAAFAEAYMLSDLLETAEDFILMHFQEVMATPKFLELTAEKLLDLLRHDALCIPSELAVFRAVVAWIEADPTQRLCQAQEVMTGVRFPFMTFREFREVRAVNLKMECSGDDDLYLYRTALKEFGFGDSSLVVQHRIRYPKDVLVVVGGDQLDPDEGQRRPSKQMWFANSLHNGTGLVKNMEWRILGEMPERARFRHGISILHKKLYVAGGCYYYSKADTMKSAYSFTHSLDQPLSGHAAVVWGGEIFISGGFNLKYQCLVSMFLYHPEQGTTYLADMVHDRAQHCMESLAQRFYVAGGVCNLREFYTDLLSCESYDPISDTWTAFTTLPLCHVGAASAVLEGKFYVLGGYSQEDYSEARLVHRYDPGTQRWENMGKMAGPVTDIRACLLHLPAHLRGSTGQKDLEKPH